MNDEVTFVILVISVLEKQYPFMGPLFSDWPYLTSERKLNEFLD